MTNTQAQTNNTTGASRSTETRYNLRANPIPKKYTNFLIHQISDAREALVPVTIQGGGTWTLSHQQKNSSENFRDCAEAADDQRNSHQKTSKNIHFQTDTSHTISA